MANSVAPSATGQVMSQETKEMFVIGNEELKKLKKLGKTVKCPWCKKKLPVQNSESGDLQFVVHGGKTWLVGIQGKNLVTLIRSCDTERGLDG